jgi:Flp pilus assembly protein TadG
MRILNHWTLRSQNRSGQALVEFMFVGFIMLFMLFGMIDFCRAISTRQVLMNLSREGANEAARGNGNTTDATISNAITAVIEGASPLDINAHGRVIISAVLNQGNGTFKITNQISEGNPTVTAATASKIGVLNATGSGATNSAVVMPFLANAQGAIPQSNQTAFVAEIFYSFQAATPLGNVVVGNIMHGITVTNQLYDVAYF